MYLNSLPLLDTRISYQALVDPGDSTGMRPPNGIQFFANVLSKSDNVGGQQLPPWVSSPP